MRSFFRHREINRGNPCEKNRVALGESRRGGRDFLCAVAVSAALGLGGCTTLPGDRIGDENDPFEPVNRVVFTFNDSVDNAVLRPVSRVYNEAVPQAVRDSVHTFLGWLRSPIIFANSLFQGDVQHANTTLIRFALNSAAFGFADIAQKVGYVHRSEDFGQTLGRYGAPEGPYMVLPFLGPSTLRDMGGRIVDYAVDPFSYVKDDDYRTAINAPRAILGIIDFRAANYDSINEIRASSLDFYTKIRTIYRQQRISAIHNGQIQTDDMDTDLLEESVFDLPDSDGPDSDSPASDSPASDSPASDSPAAPSPEPSIEVSN